MENNDVKERIIGKHKIVKTGDNTTAFYWFYEEDGEESNKVKAK